MSLTYKITKHALARAVDMALEPRQIKECIERPEIKRWDEKSGNEPGWIYKRGDLAAIADEVDGLPAVVRTFLPSNRAAWEKEALLPAPTGRNYRYLET